MNVSSEPLKRNRFQSLTVLPFVLRWSFVAILVGVLSGVATAFFLHSLAWVTAFRDGHRLIILLLPLAGLGIGWTYQQYGAAVESGSDLIIDEVHDPRAVIPLRTTPLILFATLVTHLFGGSAGREGTAVQMGASLADRLTKPFRLSNDGRKLLLMAGMSAGFGSVFGTPIAGTIFGLEVLSVGSLRFDALLPCLVAALVGDRVTQALGFAHEAYSFVVPALTTAGLLTAVVAGALFGLTGRCFSTLTHVITERSKAAFKRPALRPAFGGVVVVVLVFVFGFGRYVGLGTGILKESFVTRVFPWDFAGKLLLTAITLGFGFKGGEVTPLFFIGATLGNVLGALPGSPLSSATLAGIGFVAVFAGAANTPLACTVLAMEIFGASMGPFAAVGCVVSYLFSGDAGIYHSQRIGVPKIQSPGEKVL